MNKNAACNIDGWFCNRNTLAMVPTVRLSALAVEFGRIAIKSTRSVDAVIEDVNQDLGTCRDRCILLFYLLMCAKVSKNCRALLVESNPKRAALITALLNKFGDLAAIIINGDTARQRATRVFNLHGVVRFMEAWVGVQ